MKIYFVRGYYHNKPIVIVDRDHQVIDILISSILKWNILIVKGL